MSENAPVKHAIHIFAVVRVKVLIDPKDVSDDKPETLIRAAKTRLDLHAIFAGGVRDGDRLRWHFDQMEYVEEISHYLIDKAGDPDYLQSTFYLPDLRTDGGIYEMPGDGENTRRVVVVVKDGTVRAVLSSHKDLEHVILDHDEARALKETAPPPFKAPDFEDTPYRPQLEELLEEFDKEHHP